MIRIAIVEDNKRDYERLQEMLARYSKEKNIEFDVQYYPDAVDFISSYSYDLDLIFLDIMMPDLDGMNAAKKLRKMDEHVGIIFVTSMPQFAIEGYSVSAIYYLLKPLAYGDFSEKLVRALARLAKREEAFLYLEPAFEKRKVAMKDIRNVEIFAHDVVFHLFSEDIHVRGTLSEYEKQLDPSRFCRINSCYIVNLSYVTAVREMSVFVGEEELRMSYSRKKNLMKTLADFAAGGV